MSLVTDTIRTYLPVKRKTTPSGWISFNAPCCGDTRGRGGIIFNQGDAVSYHCFNCQFRCSWQPGRLLSHKMKNFMSSLNMDDTLINKLALESLKLHDEDIQSIRNLIPVFYERALPMDSRSLVEWENWGKLGGVDDVNDLIIEVLGINHSGVYSSYTVSSISTINWTGTSISGTDTFKVSGSNYSGKVDKIIVS